MQVLRSDSITTPRYLLEYHNLSHCFQGPIVREKILEPESARLTTYPIKYNGVWKNYKAQLGCNWVVEDVDLSSDKEDWDRLREEEQWYLEFNLSFFAGFDGVVNCQIKKNVIDVIQIREGECSFGKQYEMENVHGEMYSRLLMTYIRDEARLNHLMNSLETIPEIRDLGLWCQKWIDGPYTFAHRLVAFAFVEGVMFSSAFASIFWVKTLPGKVLQGLFKSNRYIRRDENLHLENAAEHYALCDNKLLPEVFYEIVLSGYNVLEPFVRASLPKRLRNMNAEMMLEFVQYVTDRFCVLFGYEKHFGATHSLHYMTKIDLWCKVNFFEEDVDEYATGSNGTQEFGFTEDF